MPVNDAYTSEGQLRKKKPTIIAIIPAYNEARSIRQVIEETSKFVTSIIVVDDGSEDATAEIAAASNVRVIRNKRNMGKGGSLKRGLLESTKYNPDIVVTLDGDGQHNPSDIPNLLLPIMNDHADIVVGSRYAGNEGTKDVPRYRKFGLSVIRYFEKHITRLSIKDTQSGFRAYNRRVLDTISKFDSTGYGGETEQLAKAHQYGFEITEVPVSIRYSGLGTTSKKHPALHGIEILSSILKIAIEERPLLFFGVPGVALVLSAFVPGLTVLTIFNDSRYFSIPLAIVALGLVFMGTLLIMSALFFFTMGQIRKRL